MIDSVRQDAFYALRRLRQAPGFSLVAVATLALGIGATSAIFSVVNAVLVRPLPFPESDRLARVAQTWEGRPVVYSPQNFLDVAAQAASFSGMAAVDTNGVTMTGQGAPVRLEGAEVSASFFDVLRVQPFLGRAFVAGENEPGHDRIAILGYALWRDRFGADPGVVGRTISLDREPYVVVGVAPPGLRYPDEVDIWRPLEYDQRFRSNSRGAWYLTVVGRLREGATVDGARQEVSTIADRLARAYPDANEGVGGTVIPLLDATVGESRRSLLVLTGAVGCVLLVACVNVANLLLARFTARETELAVRAALGAGGGRIVRQLLTESLLLAFLGGGVGLLVAGAIVNGLVALQPQGVPRLAEVSVDRSVVGVAAALCVLSAIVFGVFPSLQTRRRATSQALRRGGRGILAGRRGGLRGLVVAQIALAMVLLAGSALLLRSFARLRRVDPGFRTESALAFRVSLPDSAYSEDARRLTFHDELQRRLAGLPGVRSVGAVTALPLNGSHFNISFTVDGRPEVPPALQPTMEVRVATSSYFRTIGIPLRRGRAFTDADGPDAPQVVLLTESAVRKYFAGEEPIGKTIRLGLGRGPGRRRAGGEVVGVVGDVKELGLAAETPPQIYVPYAQFPLESMDVVVRTKVPPRSLASVAERVVQELDAELPVARVTTLDAVLARSVSEPRFYTLLLGSFAGTALCLAALGLFGVMSYAVAQRTRELAVRVALGARREELLRMVLREALSLGLVGVALGLAGALLLSRAIASMLFALSPRDPVTLAGVALLLLGTALLASYVPARRATRVDPVIALRSE